MPLQNPQYLYRYCSVERAIQVLRDRHLYLCPPADFNDLFEGTIARLTQYSSDAGLNLCAKIASLNHSIPIEDARVMLRERMPEIEIKRAFDDTVRWLEEPAEKLRVHSGVTCFSIRRDDQHMWASYGVNHTGVCIEFANQSGRSEIFKRAQPVLYKDGSLAEKLPELIQDDLSLNLYRLALWCYFVKGTDWRDEREWRVFTLSTQPLSYADRLLSFEPDDVRRIFCGPRMDPAMRKELGKLVAAQNSSWALIDIKPNVHAGITRCEGVDVIASEADFSYWFPEVFAARRSDRQ